MQKKLASILFSTRLTAVLFVVFAAAMIAGTFMDAGQETSPTPYTRNLIYNTWWFEAIMGFFIINFVGNMFRYRLLRKEKWATLILHIAFILILLGAFVTRYFGFEGMMAIREGATEKEFLSAETYVTAYIDGDYMLDGVAQRRVVEEMVDFSHRLDNDFEVTTKYNDQPVTIKLDKFIKGAEKDIIPDDTGEAYLKLVRADKQNWTNRVHFFNIAAQSMRHILIDYLRQRQVQKRGGHFEKVHLDEAFLVSDERATGLVELDEALKRLADLDERKSRVVELRFFAGLDNEEIAQALNITSKTVIRDWQFARSWLLRELTSQ